jgi:predicted choloylglycine hydrolase
MTAAINLVRDMRCTFEAIREDTPGARWQSLFQLRWPAYQQWFLRDGNRARSSYLAGRRALRQHMPELAGLYQQLCELAGGGDLEARFLSQWCPPSYISGCSQAVWIDPYGVAGPLLARNYDYAPALLEGSWLSTRWLGRQVLAMSDCLWGALDGINEDGLAASLSFGGRTAVGEGFGIPLVMRYLLETAGTTAEAVAILQRLPVHMTYNISLLDKHSHWATVFVAPDRPTEVVSRTAVANHQHGVEWQAHARATLSEEREWMLSQGVRKAESADDVLRTLLRPPLFQTAYGRGYGTLYTAAYHPQTLTAELLWPDMRWSQYCLDVQEGVLNVRFDANHGG